MFNMSIHSPALSTAAADSQTPWLSCPWWLCSGLFLLSISQGQNPQRGGQLPRSTATGALGEQLIPSTSCPSHPHPPFSNGNSRKGKMGHDGRDPTEWQTLYSHKNGKWEPQHAFPFCSFAIPWNPFDFLINPFERYSFKKYSKSVEDQHKRPYPSPLILHALGLYPSLRIP